MKSAGRLALSLAIAVGFLIVIPAGTASASTTVLNPTDMGWWDTIGAHTASNQNYCVGDCGPGVGSTHNYFTFSLATVPSTGGVITGATLSAVNPDGGGTLRAYTVWDVTTTAAALDVTDAGDAAGIAIYADLGGGVTFGSVTPASVDTTPIVVPLNAAAITALNAARGTTASLGGELTSATVPPDYMFAFTGGGPVTDVSLTLTIATPTKLSIKAPKMVAWGKMAKVSGKLSSTPATAACTDAQTLKVRAGSKKMTKTTAIGGGYSFKVKITKDTKVRVRYAGSADCAAAKAKKMIRVA